nr:hypothetical protein [Tanacetum cinerariifolium]
PKPTSNGKRRNRKACFVCKSLDHLINDCDYNEKKMAQPTARNHAHRESNESWPPSSLYDRFQSSDGYHVVLPPYTGTFMPPKPDLVFNNAPNGVETDHSAFTVTKPDQDLSYTIRPSAPIIEENENGNQNAQF